MAIAKRKQHFVPWGGRFYKYAHITIGDDGRKSYEDCKHPVKNKKSRNLIHTAWHGLDGSMMVYGIPFDLDYSCADSRWRTRGQLDYKKIKAFLEETYPVLGQYFATWVRSTGGKGLGLILWIDPFIIGHEKTSRVHFLASKVQRLVVEVLNFHGIGADTNAKGICRMTPNWKNGRRLLSIDEVTIRRVGRINERHNVLTNVYNEMRRSEAFKSETLADQVASGTRFAVKEVANVGLGKIYSHIIDVEPESLTINTSYEELKDISGLSIPTLRKYVPTAPWCNFKRNWGEGITLILKPSQTLNLALETGKFIPPVQRHPSSPEDWILPEPEQVMDDDRNNYLWRKSVLLRNDGLPFESAVTTILELAGRIPEAKKSRNCRKAVEILASIYRHERRQGKRKIISLEAVRNEHSITPLPRCENLSPVVASEQVASSKEEKNLVPFVGEGVSPGELPQPQSSESAIKPQPPADRPEFGLLLAFAPKAAEAIAEGRTCQNSAEPPKTKPQIAPLPPVSVPEKPKTFRTLKALRRHNFSSVNPLDRFVRAFERCLKRRTEQQILGVLRTEAPKMILLKKRYRPLDGAYKRVLEAFRILPTHIMQDLLQD